MKEEFLKNVLNAMTRFLNSIISDYLMIIKIPLIKTGLEIQPAEKLIAQYAGLSDVFNFVYPPRNPPR